MPQRRELVLEFLAPDAFSARAVAEWVPALDHELADHAVEDGVVVVAAARVRDEVFYGSGGGFGEEAEVDVAVCGVDDGRGAGVGGADFDFLEGGELFGLFVLHVARGFADFGVVGEHVEAGLAGAGADEEGVALFSLF